MRVYLDDSSDDADLVAFLSQAGHTVYTPRTEHTRGASEREEYARAGIQHYWIVDPQRRTILTLVLRDAVYEVAGEFSGGEVLTSPFFPGLALPLTRLFRS